MADAVRYGVIGAGMMGVEHMVNLQHLEGAVVTAVADPVQAQLDLARLVMGDAPLATFSNHRDLLASGLCDAVVIASPNHTHHGVLLDVLSTPHHVLVEKPLCTTVEHCRETVEAERSSAAAHPGRVVWMARALFRR